MSLYYDHTLTQSSRSRLLIAQDRDEVYLIVGSFDSAYVKYVHGKAPGSDSVLTMREYGPFHIKDQGEVEFLGEIVLAYALQGSSGETHGIKSVPPTT